MCPLRVVLIFLSAMLAGFFVLRNLRVQPEPEPEPAAVDGEEGTDTDTAAVVPFSTKVGSAISSGFWACVDMASGRYLWRALVSPTTPDGGKKGC